MGAATETACAGTRESTFKTAAIGSGDSHDASEMSRSSTAESGSDSPHSQDKAMGFVRWAEASPETRTGGASVPDSHVAECAQLQTQTKSLKQVFPPEYYAALEAATSQMQSKGLHCDSTFGFAECLRKEHLLHSKYVECGVEDTQRHALAVAHIEEAQRMFQRSMQQRGAALEAASCSSPRPPFYRHARSPLALKEAHTIERLQAHASAVVSIQNEARRTMQARELLAFETPSTFSM
jgi:hypothetical protein